MQTPNYGGILQEKSHYGGMLHYGGILPSELPGTYLVTHAGEILLLMREKRIHDKMTSSRRGNLFTQNLTSVLGNPSSIPERISVEQIVF